MVLAANHQPSHHHRMRGGLAHASRPPFSGCQGRGVEDEVLSVESVWGRRCEGVEMGEGGIRGGLERGEMEEWIGDRKG